MAGGDSTAVKNLLNSAQSGRILSKDMDQYVKACYNGDMPACRTVCPLGLNVVQFVSKLQKGNFNSAYGQYREKAIFPAIACRLCDQPCLEACVRKSLDNSIDIRKLERAAVDFTRTTIPEKYSIPKKAGRIAVIGAGLCGLSCTYKLASHGYAVTVYEKDVMTGGRLWDLLEPEDFRDELEVQLQQLEYGLNLETEISCIDDLKSEYNAILVATGLDGEAFGLLEELNRDSLGSAVDGIFLAGSLLGANPIQSIENGIRAARSIESWLQTGRMHVIQGAEISKASRLQVNLKNLKRAEGVKAERYSREEAATEASRCLKCDCRECMEVCDLMKYYDKLPARIVNDVRVSLNAVDQLTQKVATRLISSCNDCGLCGAVCSENIDMGDFLLDARRIMHREGTMPPVFHDFWMRDMKHAEGEDAYIAKNAPGHGSSDYLFFPGCQLGASDPAYVESTYEYLLDKYPGTGILVGCCGAPAEWAGDEPLTLAHVGRLRSQWEVMGRPVALLACPTCEKMFAKYLPEIKTKSIYEYIAEKGLPGRRQEDKAAEQERAAAADHAAAAEQAAEPHIVSVFDPCTSKYDQDMQRDVRRLLEQSGLALKELPYSGKTALCCGFGGHIQVANPELTKGIVSKRIELGSEPYITYCTNCRDAFAERGKSCKHLLDVLFNLNDWHRKPPSLTQRRDNRESLKADLLERVWKEEAPGDMGKTELQISAELTEKLNNEFILEDDLRKTVEYCESSGNKLLDAESGCFIGHQKRGYLTYWVVYSIVPGIEGQAYRIMNAYSHRLNIEGE